MRIEWIIPGLLAGSARPGLLAPLEKDLDILSRFGFSLVVNLTETPPVSELDDAGFQLEHFPIPDMGVPTPRSMAEACEMVLEHVARGDKALVHCKAGLGRTGTFLACCLIHQGLGPEEAITSVRLVNPRFIQSQTQERFVHHYAEFLADKNPGGEKQDATRD